MYCQSSSKAHPENCFCCVLDEEEVDWDDFEDEYPTDPYVDRQWWEALLQVGT